MELLSILLRTFIFYFFIVFTYRIMGKREVGQLGIIDLIVSILIAELVAISIENIKDPIFYTILPICLLVVLEILLAFISIKSKKFRNIFGGKPSLIICNGKINYKEMVKQRYSLDDLLMELRQKEIKSIEKVEYAFLETNGKLSIFKYNAIKIKSNYPMPLIIDGNIQHNTLKQIHKNSRWLINILNKKKISVKNVFYCFYKGYKLYIINKNDVIN